MASEDPTAMFADMKKKKKKPKVAFSEEPASADADPTYPPKEPINDPALGPITAHERLATSAAANAGAPEDAEADDLKNMFGDLKRKKKKKDLVVEEPEPVPVAEEAADNLDFSDLKKPKKKKEVQLDLDDGAAPLDDFSDLKRKKKKKDIPMDLEGEAPPAEGADDFSDLKKKKKVLAMEDFEKELGGNIAPVAKPKKAKKVAIEENEEGEEEEDGEFDEIEEVDEAELGENPFAAGAGGGGRDGESAAWVKDDDKDYTYDELLSRFFRLLHAANPNLASSSGKRYTLAPPSIHRDGNKKSVFANIGDICKRMHREPQHVINFLLTEMGTTGSVDGSGRLVIKGKFQQKQVENILRRYIVEYVTCKTCKSPDTLLTKETRISFITCETCGSRQSVSAIKAGFTAQVGKRKKQQV